MRNKLSIIFIFLFVVSGSTYAIDTLLVNLKEIVVVSPRESQTFQEQPVSYSSISEEKIENNGVKTLHDLSGYVPNFFMPEYGSKITSSIYVRGIGSRMNEPSVGLYVDNIPYLDKSAFDFDFYDIQHIDFLRGPQGTLYGRNSIAGLINISTLSPFNYQGTKLFASYGNANDQLYRISHYQKINDKAGFSLAGYYHGNDGFFKNEFRGEKDKSRSLGARGKFDWRFTPRWEMNISLLYDKNKQNAYPYAPYNPDTDETGSISYNEEGSYKRDMLVAGLTFQRKSDIYLFTSATSYQWLDDAMKIDQDFTADSIYALTQNQKQHVLTQEFVFRSADEYSPYKWVTGAFGFYKNNDVDAPMLFRRGGLDIIQNAMSPMLVLNEEMNIPGFFKIPAYGAALYHQSSYTFWDKLTLTAGLRAEYEKTSIDYNTYASISLGIARPGMIIPVLDSTYTNTGKITQEFWQLLPKVALKYDINDRYNVYASVSKGYKTGGFNFQMFSDVLSSQMQQSRPGTTSEEINPEDIIAYKPETTINYEVGTHSEIIEGKLFVDASLFYIDYANQQIVTFASTNTGGRMMENAGRSESMGAEVAARTYINNFNFNAAYGYTRATFKDYDTNDGNDYSGNYIPLVPQHTLSLTGEYKWNINREFLDNITFNVQYNAFGKMYFTEENIVSQDFYGLLNANIAFERKNLKLTCWTKNLLDQDYKAFYFTSLNNSFIQKGKPFQIGASLQLSINNAN